MIPDRYAGLVSWITLIIEGGLGAALGLGFHLSLVMLATSALFAAFATHAFVSLRRSGQSSCGCLGGAVALDPGWAGVVMNSGVAILLLLGGLTSGATGGSPAHMDAVVLVMTAGLASLIYWLVLYGLTVRNRVLLRMAPGGIK